MGLGVVYPLLFWTMVSIVLALWAAGLVTAKSARVAPTTRVIGLAPSVLFFVVFLFFLLVARW